MTRNGEDRSDSSRPFLTSGTPLLPQVSLLREVESLRGLKISTEKSKTAAKSRYSVAGSGASWLSRDKGAAEEVGGGGKNDEAAVTTAKASGTPRRSPRPSMNSPARASSALASARKKKMDAEFALMQKKVEVLTAEVEAQKLVIQEKEEEVRVAK